MRLAGARAAPYALRLRAPLGALGGPGGAAAAERTGWIVRLEDDQGHTGYGEAAPLWGHSPESPAQLAAALKGFVAKAPGARFDELEALFTAASEWEGAPMGSFVFALEMAWLGLEARRRGTIPARVLSDRVHPRVPVAAFLGAPGEAEPALEPGGVLKVKVGRAPTQAEGQALCALASRLPEGARLRLDANRSLSLAEATLLFSALDPARVDFVEEPLQDPADATRLYEATGHAIALDETLLEPGRHGLLAAAGVQVWVLKPARLGGVLAALGWIEAAGRAGRKAVVSSTYESGLGLEFLAQLQALANAEPVAAGLGTGRLFEEDLAEAPPAGAALDPGRWTGRPSAAWLARVGWGPG